MKFLTELIHKKRVEHDTRQPSPEESHHAELEPAIPGTPVEMLRRPSSAPVTFEQFAANHKEAALDDPDEFWAEDETANDEWAVPFAAAAEQEYLDEADEDESTEDLIAQFDADAEAETEADAEEEALTFASHGEADEFETDEDISEEDVATESESIEDDDETALEDEPVMEADTASIEEEVDPEPFSSDDMEPEMFEEPEEALAATETEDRVAEFFETESVTDNTEEVLAEPAGEDEIEPVAEKEHALHIWDLENKDEPTAGIPDDWDAEVAEVAASIPLRPRDTSEQGEGTSRRAGRVRTRLLGFHRPDEAEADPFGRPQKKAGGSGEPQFPVGWLVIESGPGRGTSFALLDGVSKIGRDDDQAVQLDFGDVAISRDNHAVIAYDNELRGFFVGQGGKANLVRINGMPLLSTEPLTHGDRIRIGETTLRFVALCGPDFDWSTNSELGGLDVAAG